MKSDALIQAPIGVLALLLAAVAVADALSRLGSMKRLGAAVIVIFIGALLANFRIIPPAASGGAVYDLIYAYLVPAAIFLMLLHVNLGALKRAGGVMIGAFGLGAIGTFLGVWIATAVIPVRAMVGDMTGPLAGMFAGTYIGGGANFNAVAVAFNVTRDSGVYTAATVVDNVMTDVWIIAMLALPALLVKTRWFGAPTADRIAATEANDPASLVRNPVSGVMAISMPIALTALAVWFSDAASAFLAARGVTVPPVLIVTTLALIAAQVPYVARLTEAGRLGLWAIYLFLAVAGANADLAALVAAGRLTPILFAYVAVIFAAHAGVLFGAGALLKIEPVVLAIASSANIGGSTTAFVLAEAEERHDLVLPAILIGSLGNALGTYLGFIMAALLR